MSPLAILLVLGAAAGVALAADSPFEGTWKVLLPQAQFEISLWILKIDKEGKAVEVVAGAAPQFKDAKVSNVKAGKKSLSFLLNVAGKGGNPQVFAFTIVPPSADDKETVRGACRIGPSMLPCWLEKTEQTDIDPKTAQQQVGAFGDLEAALKKEKADEKIKELYEVGKSHLGRPVGLVALDVLLGELNKSKAKPEQYKEYAREAVKAVEQFGTLMQVGKSLGLANVFRNNKDLAPLALELSQNAVKLLDDDMPFNTRLTAQLGLAASLIVTGKKEEADKLAPEAKRLAEEVVKAQKKDEEKLSACMFLANTLNSSQSPVIAALALDFARRGVGFTNEETPSQQRSQAHEVFLAMISRHGKAEDAEAAKKAIEVIIPANEGPRRLPARAFIINNLVSSKVAELADLGLEHAQKAMKALKDDSPPGEKVAINKLYVNALTKRGKAEEAKKAAAALEKLEADLDAEFVAKNIEFKVDKFAGRKGKSTRVVLVELFTGAQCPPCVSADIAFDASLKAFEPRDVAFLQYHLHIPGPDPLTNDISESRQQYYREEVQGTPALILDGKGGPALGGRKNDAEDRFGKLKEAIEKNLEVDQEGAIKLDVQRDGSKITISASASDLKEAGDKVKLRIALVEEVARFQGGNGQRLHHNVVRTFAGGLAGFPLEKKEGATHKATVDVEELRKKLDGQLNIMAANLIAQNRAPQGFQWPDRPLKLAKLKVIAFVQDDDSKRILQAAQADVPDGK
jgi:hypothetical protein